MKLSELRNKYSYVLPSLPDNRDHLYVAGTTNKKSASLKEYRGRVLDQGLWGSCTGHGTAGMLHTLYKRITADSIDFSPYWIWYWARKANGWEKQNSGAYPRDVFKNLVKIGVCEDSEWKQPSDFHEPPPEIGDEKLIKFQGYKRFNFNKKNFDNIINDFFYCIGEEKLPVGITMAVHTSFETHTKDTGELLMPKSNDPVVGYHWVYVDEVDETGITLVNSWSYLWGDNGTFKMSWDYVKNYVVEAWSLDPKLP